MPSRHPYGPHDPAEAAQAVVVYGPGRYPAELVKPLPPELVAQRETVNAAAHLGRSIVPAVALIVRGLLELGELPATAMARVATRPVKAMVARCVEVEGGLHELSCAVWVSNDPCDCRDDGGPCCLGAAAGAPDHEPGCYADGGA